jgi:diguanylate cyclase (GGDEF)-like protein
MRSITSFLAQPGDLTMEPKPVRILLASPHLYDYLFFQKLLAQLDGCHTRLDHLPAERASLESLPPDSHDIWFLDCPFDDKEGLPLAAWAASRKERPILVALVRGQDPAFLKNLFESGIDDFLVKGRLDAGHLEATLKEALRRREETGPNRRRSAREVLKSMVHAGAWFWEWDTLHQTIRFPLDWKVQAGFPATEALVHPTEWLDRVHPEDRALLEDRLSALREGKIPSFDLDYRIAFVGGWRWLRCHAARSPGHDDAVSWVGGSHQDVTDLKKLQEQLAQHAYTDDLTGLANRALFLNRLEQALARFARYPEQGFAVIALDVDHFKRFLDSAGYRAGDRAILEISKRLVVQLRTVDTVARVGEDQFALLLADVEGVADVLAAARRLSMAMSEPIRMDGQECVLPAKMGIVLSHSGYNNPEDILHDAFTAMYRAKGGRNGPFELFDPDMRRRAKDRLQMEGELRQGLKRGELRLFYQPIIQVSHGGLSGFEALVRWQHPERGLIPPSEFLPLAEETGLIIPLGEWVLREACRQMRQWTKEFGLSEDLAINVNLSSRQLGQADLAGRVLEAVRESGLDPSRLRLEITESALFENEETSLGNLRRLKAHRLKFHLDDFGTGYSSLSHLCLLPIDAVKVDRSFVSRMHEPGRPTYVVKAIVLMARELGLGVVAEGVEKELHYARLKELDCAEAQGYYFSKPVEPDAIGKLLSAKQTW